MKLSVILILTAILLVGSASSRSTSLVVRETAPTIVTQQTSDKESTGKSSTDDSQTVIQPGVSMGSLKIGDTRERALEMFPQKPGEDQEWKDSCGVTINWLDTDNKIRGGNVFIRLKKDKVFQIESATTRFHTIEGISSLDGPDKVAQNYKDLRAYVLLTKPNAALGDRPLIYWIDKKKGIAFSFAYYPTQHKRYLYKIIIFEPNKNFCPEEESTSSPKWQPIPPYSLEPPSDLALNRLHDGRHQNEGQDSR